MIDRSQLMFGQEPGAEHRSGFVALLGKPNVGKSTLLNAWLGCKLVAVSSKPQTTRKRFLAILTRPDAQVMFYDTPGLHLPRNRLGEYMVAAVRTTIPDVDLILFMVDVSEMPGRPDQEIAQLIAKEGRGPALLVLNKIDTVGPQDLVARCAAYEALGSFERTYAVSATAGQGIAELLEDVIGRLPLGPRFYPEDQLTDEQERFIAAELIREHLLRQLQQEVPHSSAVIVSEFKDREDGKLYIGATIYVEKDSQKGIVIGRGGAMIKDIGRSARRDLEQFFERPVYLDLWVKVRKNWRQDERSLKQLGYH